MSRFWTAVVGVLAVAVIVSLVSLYSGSRPVGSENLIGEPLPSFAAPLARATLTGDANIYTPAQAKSAHATAACAVRIEGAFNSCRDLKGPAIITFFNTTKPECVAHVTTLDRLLDTRRGVSAVAVAFDETEAKVRAFVRGKGWRLPVAIDRDGAVASLYSVAGCPTTFFADAGRISAVHLGVLTTADFEDRINAVRSGATTGRGE